MHIPKQIATEDTFILQKSESSGHQPSLVTGLLYLLKSVLRSDLMHVLWCPHQYQYPFRDSSDSPHYEMERVKVNALQS